MIAFSIKAFESSLHPDVLSMVHITPASFFARYAKFVGIMTLQVVDWIGWMRHTQRASERQYKLSFFVKLASMIVIIIIIESRGSLPSAPASQ